MTNKFILWAQALDNTSSDHFDMRGKVLDPSDTERRQEAVSLVSSVIKKGERIFEEGGVLMTADSKHYIVEVLSAQRDSVGRTAPIVCYGEYDATVGDSLGSSVAATLDNFAKRIGRKLQPEQFELVQRSFNTLKKKYSTMKIVRALLIGVVGLLLIVYFLAQKIS